MRRLTARAKQKLHIHPDFKLIPRHAANTDTPWTSSSMSNSDKYTSTSAADPPEGSSRPRNDDASPNPTIAAFSPNQQTAARTRNRASIVIHQKSPLLLSTPPAVTRTLAYSHPFILPLNHFVALLSWTTGDVWESFLLLAVFWVVVSYGDEILRWAGPLVVVVGLILGMYARRYSPLSSTVWSGHNKKSARKTQQAESDQRKSLDEILDTLKVFTDRCEVLLDPFWRLTEFLSTQSSATSATTRPALTTLFLRICALTPVWILLSSPYLHVITSRRIVLVVGTVGLSWHAYPARVTRTILWRSRTVRRLCTLLTGLDFVISPPPATQAPQIPTPSSTAKSTSTASALQAKGTAPGVRFTFTLYENQRRWIGAGWTSSLLAYERQAWTDEHLNPTPDPTHFTLPDAQEDTNTQGTSTTTQWRWLPHTTWRVEGATTTGKERSAKRIGGGGGGDESGWVYYDNKWMDGRRVDGWGRYTRRRKWMRDAELVEGDGGGEEGKGQGAPSDAGTIRPSNSLPSSENEKDSASVTSPSKKKAGGWFASDKSNNNAAAAKTTASSSSSFSSPAPPPQGPKTPAHHRRTATNHSDAFSGSTTTTSSSTRSATGRAREGEEEDVHTPAIRYKMGDYWDRSIGDGLAEGMG